MECVRSLDPPAGSFARELLADLPTAKSHREHAPTPARGFFVSEGASNQVATANRLSCESLLRIAEEGAQMEKRSSARGREALLEVPSAHSFGLIHRGTGAPL